jgi:hypothetical protein
MSGRATRTGGDESVVLTSVLISGILVNPRSISWPKTDDRILNGTQLNNQHRLSEMASQVLEQSQREAFYENGSVQACNNPFPRRLILLWPTRYLVIPGFFSQGAVEAMLTRAKELIDEVDLESHPMVRELDMYLLRLLISWFL